MANIAEIKTDFLTRRSEIDALDQELAAERRQIQNTAIDESRTMTTEEVARRKEIGATRQELAEAMEVIALATLDRLNRSEDVEHLNAELKRINTMLKDDLEHLQTLERHAENAAKVIAGIASVAGKLTKVALPG